ncbi:MAG TPA: ATP-binding protein [Myxococcaceae bacterium]|nr:ATP-binding protein [Myxococcaceae bacterium]
MQRTALSLATRIFLGHAAVLLTFGVVALFSVAELHRSQQEMRLVGQGYLQLSQDAAALESFEKNQVQESAQIIREQNPETRAALIQLAPRTFPPLVRQRLASALGTLQTMRVDAPADERRPLEDLQTRLEQLVRHGEEADRAAAEAYQALATGAPGAAERVSALALRQEAVGREVRALRAAVEARIAARVDRAERRERSRGLLVIALTVLAIGVGFLATALSARSLAPVRTLIEGVGRVRQGDYAAQLLVRGEDEIAQLASEFNAMSRELAERQRQLAEKQRALLLAERLAAVGRVSAQVAHEVRNPLSSIGLNTELLHEAVARARFSDEAAEREAKALLAAIGGEVDRLTEVTDQYLRLARLPRPALEAEDVNLLLERVLDFSREELERARVAVVRDLDPSLPRALADEAQLRQVFLNLLRNSREAMPGGGTLRVSSRCVDGTVEVSIADSGPGIPPEVQARLFEPFFSTKTGGTGLGLALARQILEAHGGSIACASTASEGTTFVLRVRRA